VGWDARYPLEVVPMAPAVTYQETLRTLGTLLNQAGRERDEGALSAQGAVINADPWAWQPVWDAAHIGAESDVQRSWRLDPRTRNTPRAGRVGNALRVVGAALDADGGGPFAISVERDVVRVQGPGGYERTFGEHTLQRRQVLGSHLRGQLPA